jgi:hypothetical protein
VSVVGSGQSQTQWYPDAGDRAIEAGEHTEAVAVFVANRVLLAEAVYEPDRLTTGGLNVAVATPLELVVPVPVSPPGPVTVTLAPSSARLLHPVTLTVADEANEKLNEPHAAFVGLSVFVAVVAPSQVAYAVTVNPVRSTLGLTEQLPLPPVVQVVDHPPGAEKCTTAPTTGPAPQSETDAPMTLMKRKFRTLPDPVIVIVWVMTVPTGAVAVIVRFPAGTMTVQLPALRPDEAVVQVATVAPAEFLTTIDTPP